MKNKIFYFMASAIIFASSCDSKTAEKAEEKEVAMTEETTVEEKKDNHYGEVINEEGAMTVDEFASKMNGQDSIRTKIRAIAEDVCQKKGCWMKVKAADGSLMRIKFKDYGFFVPMDITGKEVIFEGVAFKDTTSVEDLKHFAEDGGQSPEEIAAITEPEVSTAFIADGVIIVE